MCSPGWWTIAGMEQGGGKGLNSTQTDFLVGDVIFVGVGSLTSYSEVEVPHIRNPGLLWLNLTQRASVRSWLPTTSRVLL